MELIVSLSVKTIKTSIMILFLMLSFGGLTIELYLYIYEVLATILLPVYFPLR